MVRCSTCPRHAACASSHPALLPIPLSAVPPSLLPSHYFSSSNSLSPSAQSVTLKTDLGDIKIEVFCESVPKTAEARGAPLLAQRHVRARSA